MPHETLNWKIHDDHDQVQRCVCPPPKDTSASGPPWDAKVDTGSTLAACEQGIAGRPTGLVAERQKPIMSNLNPTSRHLLMKIIKTPARQTIVHLQPESGTFPQAQHHRHEHVYLKEHNIMIEPVTAEAAPPSIFQIRLNKLLLTSPRLARKDLRIERELNRKKWFDYRFMSPMEATLQFREIFQDVYRRKYSINIDSGEADQKTGVSKKLSRADLTSFWRARQFADSLGVTYEVFLEAAFQALIRRGWERLPHVNQLYGIKNHDAIVHAVKALWAEQIRCRFTFSLLSHYRLEVYRDLTAQIDHLNWVKEQLQAQHGSSLGIGRACYVHRVLPEDDARREFGQERLDRAKDEILFSGLIRDETSVAELALPSCFGLPGAPDPGEINATDVRCY
jgi:hypothetical protein